MIIFDSSIDEMINTRIASLTMSSPSYSEMFDDNIAVEPQVALTRGYQQPPRHQDRYPHPNHTQNCSNNNSSVCPCCARRHPGGPEWCAFRGPEFIKDQNTRQAVTQYNVKFGDKNPLLAEQLRMEQQEKRTPRQAILPRPAIKKETHFASAITTRDALIEVEPDPIYDGPLEPNPDPDVPLDDHDSNVLSRGP